MGLVMLKRWRRRLQVKRAKPGDGSPLPAFRWWHSLTRTLFTVDLPDSAGSSSSYAVDVRQLGDKDDGEVRARLYIDGVLTLVSRTPARFEVPGGEIEVVAGAFGMKRCHFIAADGSERQLIPHPRTAEGRRAKFDHHHPVISHIVGMLATILVLVGLGVAIPAIIETISQVPPIADNLGTFESPFTPTPWLSITIGVAAALGSIERALRLRSSWIDHLAG